MNFTEELDDLFTEPSPSICDICRYAVTVSGSFIQERSGKTYRQRYCHHNSIIEQGGADITTDGAVQCIYHIRLDQ